MARYSYYLKKPKPEHLGGRKFCKRPPKIRPPRPPKTPPPPTIDMAKVQAAVARLQNPNTTSK